MPAAAHAAWGTGLVAWLPLVGAVIGGLVAAVAVGASLVLPPMLAGLLGAAAWVLLTGGLHLDGVADCGDGLACAASREKRLEIMKDPRLGSFGALALGLVVLVKIFALGSLCAGGTNQTGEVRLILACVLAAVLGRAQIPLAFATQKMARPGGLGETVKNTMGKWELWIALVISAALCAGLRWRGLAAFLAAALVFLALTSIARTRLGGVTGDVVGALVETTEAAVLVVFCAHAPQGWNL